MANIISELPQITKLLEKIENTHKSMCVALPKIPDDELDKIISKQERRMAMVAHLMEYGYKKVKGMAESGYRIEVIQSRNRVVDNAKVEELLAQGMTAYEIMESGGPITDQLIELWIEETEGDIDG